MCSPSVGGPECNRKQHLEQKEEGPGCGRRGGGPWKRVLGWNILASGLRGEKARCPVWGTKGKPSLLTLVLPLPPAVHETLSLTPVALPPAPRTPRTLPCVQKRVQGGGGCWSEGGGRSQEPEASLGSAGGIFQTGFSSGPSLSSSVARHDLSPPLPHLTSLSISVSHILSDSLSAREFHSKDSGSFRGHKSVGAPTSHPVSPQASAWADPTPW